MLELYHWEPNGLYLKPLIALKEKNASFTSHYFDATKFEQFAPGFPANTESGLHLEREGPLLVDDGLIISSTFFMLEYIAEALPGTELLPGNAFEHYRARAWGQFLGLSLGAIVGALGCAKYLVPVLKGRDRKTLQASISAIEPQERRVAWATLLDSTYDEKAIAAAREKLRFPVKRVEDALSVTRWLCGSAYSIADIDAFAMLSVLPDLAPHIVNETATPHIHGFLARMRERPAVTAALAMSKTGKPQAAFVPGGEPSRWG
jgi:GST-like protein